ncbi:MAG: DinB family protein [Bacteroidetes bacterium]|nr:DinB family protein [Bacteroidota bacterium]
MQETPAHYTERILSNLDGRDPLKVLRSTPKRIEKMISSVSRAVLVKRPAPSRWSVAEIVAHLAETELVLGWRYRSIAEKNGVPLQPFDQDVWAANSQYGTCGILDMLELFTVLRKANLNFLASLPKKKWNNFGLHQERGKETILHIVRLEAGHDLNHVKQIEAIVKKP